MNKPGVGRRSVRAGQRKEAENRMKKNKSMMVLLAMILLIAATWLMTLQGSLRVSAETGAGVDIGSSDGDVDGDGFVEGKDDSGKGAAQEIGEGVSKGLDDVKEGAEDVRDRINGMTDRVENEGRGSMETDPGVVKGGGEKMTEKDKDHAAGWIAAAVVVAAAAIALVIALVPKRKK